MNKAKLDALLEKAQEAHTQTYSLHAALAGKVSQFNDDMQEVIFEERNKIMEIQSDLIHEIEIFKKGESNEE